MLPLSTHLLCHWSIPLKSLKKGVGSGSGSRSISQRCGSGSQHCRKAMSITLPLTFTYRSQRSCLTATCLRSAAHDNLRASAAEHCPAPGQGAPPSTQARSGTPLRHALQYSPHFIVNFRFSHPVHTLLGKASLAVG
jgi:hypothetical protein